MIGAGPAKSARRLPREIPALVVLGVLVAIGVAMAPGFLHLELRAGRLWGVPVDILKTVAPVLLTGTGMTLVIATGCIDLSVGSTMALAGACAALLINRGSPVWVAAGSGLTAGLAVGLVNGALVNLVRLQPIVATLATLVVVRGLAQWLTDDQKIRFSSASFESFGTGTFLSLPVPVWIAGSSVLLLSLLQRMTPYGLGAEAAGNNSDAANRCGVSVPGVRATAYAATGILAAAAGLIAAADIGEADVANAGLSIELDAILAVVLGGTVLTGGRARLAGTVVGAVLMQTLTTLLQMKGVLTDQTLVIKAAVAFAAAAAQAPGMAQWFLRESRQRVVQ